MDCDAVAEMNGLFTSTVGSRASIKLIATVTCTCIKSINIGTHITSGTGVTGTSNCRYNKNKCVNAMARFQTYIESYSLDSTEKLHMIITFTKL
jgi:hypothetical protein